MSWGRHKLRPLAFLFLLIAAVLFFAGCAKEETAQDTDTVAVEVINVGRADITKTLTLSGYLTGKEEVNIIPKAISTIKQVCVKVGDMVHKGQTLVVLNSDELEAQLKQMEANYAQAKSAYDEAKNNYQRMLILYNEGAVSLQQLESAKGTMERSGVDSAAAAIDTVREQLDNMVITAPFDGVVASLNAEVGAMASQQSAIAVISNMNSMLLKTSVGESNINSLSVGENIDVTIRSLNDKVYSGKISSVAPAADAVSRTFPIEILIANPEGLLKSGMFAETTITTEKQTNVLCVPKEALLGQTAYSVFVLKDDGTVEKRAIVTGIESNDMIKVLSGLSEGEVVVTKGQHLLQDGDQVRVVGQ